ncbi:MAG: hypothetical protein ACI4JA_04135 [Oscillospiraceae bacterium]
MLENIPIPLFLQAGKAQELNNKLIQNNKSFAFLGEPSEIINKIPSTYAEAFDQYISGLYVLYHDYGMFFLKGYTNQAININNEYRYYKHLNFVFKARGVLQHSDDYFTSNYVYKALKNYYFREDETFSFNDWHEFWLNAEENHWKKLVSQIIADSDKFYNDYMIKIAAQDNLLKNIYESLFQVFSTGEYYDNNNGNCVNMYDRSLDKRFINNICNKLKHTFSWSDESKAQKELKCFKNQDACSMEELHEVGKLTPQEIKSEAVKVMKTYLLSGDCQNSESLFQILCQTIYDLIQNQIIAEINSDTDDMLE